MIKKIFEKKILFKKLILISVICLTILSLIGTASAAVVFSGSGTLANPYEISTIEDLKNFSTHYNENGGGTSYLYYKLTADIPGEGATVQGLATFNGSFVGDKKKISNIKIEPASGIYPSGMFGSVKSKSVIENISFDYVEITHNVSGDDNQIHAVGILAGTVDGELSSESPSGVVILNIEINNSIVNMGEDTLALDTTAGGLIGESKNATVRNITITNTQVKSAASKGQIGGMIGHTKDTEKNESRKIENISITNITVTGNTTSLTPADNSVGGVVGKTDYAIIKDVVIAGATITGNDNVGGVIGNATDSYLHSSSIKKYNNKISGNVKITGVKINDTDDGYGGKQVGGIFGNSLNSHAYNVMMEGTEANPIEINGQVNVAGGYGKAVATGSNYISIENISISWMNVTGVSETAAGVGNSTAVMRVANTSVSNAVIKAGGENGGEHIGILFGYLDAKNSQYIKTAEIENCIINAPGGKYVGGVAGKIINGGKISSNSSETIRIDHLEIETNGIGDSVGGYFGSASGTGLEIRFAELDNIKINATPNTGGLIGYLSVASGTQTNIGYNESATGINNSNVTVKNLQIKTDKENRKSDIGGMIGNVTGSGTLRIGTKNVSESSTNPSGVAMVKTQNTYGENNVGGMIGFCNANLYVENIYFNNAKLYFIDDGGALIGKVIGPSNITMLNASVNTVIIEGVNSVGGGIGNVTGNVNVTTNGFQLIDSNIKGTNNYTGGIIGMIDTGSYSNNLINISNVEIKNELATNTLLIGKNDTGGIIGYMKGPTESKSDLKISDITINNMMVNSKIGTGGIVGTTYDVQQIDLMNITSNNVTITGTNQTGGVFGLRGGSSNTKNISTFKNIRINDLAIRGGDDVGGIAGTFRNSSIENVSINNINITAGDYVGGLFGTTEGKADTPMNIGNSSKENDVSLTGNITISGDICVGGLVGNGKNLNITNINFAYSATPANAFNVNGTEYVGGLVGTSVENTSVTDVTLTNVRVKGADNVSAVVGKSLNGTFKNVTVNNSYIESPNTEISGNIGGLTGTADRTKIEAVYINGLILNSSTERVGGIVGNMEASELKDSRINNSTIGGKQHTGGAVGIAKYLEGYENKIENLTVYNTSITGTIFCGGLTGEAFSQEINNSRVIDSTVTGTQYTGGLVGRQSSGNITVSSVLDTTGNNVVKGEMHVGGFVGQIEGNVSNCSAQINVSNTTGNGNYTGGFAGTLNKEVKNSFSTGNVKAQAGEVGGFSGRQSGTSENCYSTGNVDGGMFGGSFTGNLTSGNITNCYSTGNVTSTVAGGLAGTAVTGSKITNAMALGAYVNGTTADKLIGSGSATITDTFVWNGMKKANGEITNTKGVPAVKSYNVWDTYGTPKIPSGLKKSEWDETWSSTVWKNNDLDSSYKYLLPVFTWQTTASDAPNADASHILYMTDIKIKVMEAV